MRSKRALVGACVSAGCLGAVVVWAVRQDAPRIPTSPDALLLIAASVAIYAAATALRGWRWHRVLRHAGVPHARADAYALVTVGYMGNAVLPARGGELLRILLLAGRTDARRRDVLGSIIAERALDLVVLIVLFAGMTWASVGGSPTGQAPAALAGGGLVAVALVVLGYMRLRARGHLSRLADVLRPFLRASRIVAGRRGLPLLAVTSACWLLEGVIFLLVGHALEIGLNLIEATFLVVLTSFFALIPAAPGYVGTFEAALLFGLSALDVRGSDAVAFALLVRFVLFVPIVVAGLVILWLRYGGLQWLRRATPDGGPRPVAANTSQGEGSSAATG